jgi:hypothetical protein
VAVSPVVLAAAATSIAVLYLAARRFASAGRVALADTDIYSLDWLTSADHRPLPAPDHPPPAADGWRTVTVCGLAAAEDLLDLLEATGYEEQELIVLGDSRFAVRWR